MEPDVIRGREGIQLSYELPFRLFDTLVYPRKSSNGSNVLLCAHERGLRVIWYAGKRLKPVQQPSVNGNNNNNIVLTEDDEDFRPHYEEELEEVDPAKPFNNVVHHTDIDLGTATVKIAVPPLSSEHSDEQPHITNTHIVIFAACADFSLRLVSIPLEPNHEPSKTIHQVAITGANSHQDLVSGLAITISGTTTDEEDTKQGNLRTRPVGGESEKKGLSADSVKQWLFLLASTSPTGTGLLLIHQIPLNSHGQVSDDAACLVPTQRRFLRSPLINCSVEFNPSLYPSFRHANLLIASQDASAVKIYHVLPQKGVSKRRRSSTATTDSAMSTGLTKRKGTVDDKILINLSVPFQSQKEDSEIATRKHVLSAKWVLHGRGVLALLDDGEWGVWDLEAAGPGPAMLTNNLVKGQSNITGIQGGSVTRFTIRATISASGSHQKSEFSTQKEGSQSTLAPMTPHTRKMRSQGLFQNQRHEAQFEGSQATQIRNGHVAVLVQVSDVAGSKFQDEAVVLSYGSTKVLIGSLQSYWRSEIGDRGSFDGSINSRPIVLPQLQTGGEILKAIRLMSRTPSENVANSIVSSKPNQDFVAVTSSRLILFVSALSETFTEPKLLSLPSRLSQKSSSISQDQMLLDSGELDVDGMDRILHSMADSETMSNPKSLTNSGFFGRKSVGFQLDQDDMSIDTETPTAARGSKSRLLIGSGAFQQGNGRRLFT